MPLSDDPKWIKKESEYRGQSFTYYEMNKVAFTLVAMRFKTDEAYEWQIKFAATFALSLLIAKKIDGTLK